MSIGARTCGARLAEPGVAHRRLEIAHLARSAGVITGLGSPFVVSHLLLTSLLAYQLGQPLIDTVLEEGLDEPAQPLGRDRRQQRLGR
eukprot:scaffold18619_cov60-Phaeocystis_antarctica.AAC.1